MTDNECDDGKPHNRAQKAKPQNIQDIMARVVCAQRNGLRAVVCGGSAVFIGSLHFFFRSVGCVIEDCAEIGKAPHGRVAHISPLALHTYLSLSVIFVIIDRNPTIT